MPDFNNLPCHDKDGDVHVVVEAPRHSRVKLKYDPEKNAFVFHRTLLLGLAYPYDWGFVPSTRAEDGDPLDAMVLWDGSSWPGVVIPSTPIGIVRLTQKDSKKGERQQNDRVIAVPVGDPCYADVSELGKRTRRELEEFFIAISRMSDKKVDMEGWDGPKAARAAIQKAAETYVRAGA